MSSFSWPFKMINKAKKIVNKIFVFLLFLIFVYWSTEAVLKYLDEPATTNIHFTLGDTVDGIQFPGSTNFLPQIFSTEIFHPWNDKLFQKYTFYFLNISSFSTCSHKNNWIFSHNNSTLQVRWNFQHSDTFQWNIWWEQVFFVISSS